MRPLEEVPMPRLLFPRSLALASALLVAASAAFAQGAAGYHVVKRIPIGGEGGWDYLFVDSPAHRLYVSHGTRAVVINLDTDSVVGEVTPANGIHGVAVVPALDRGFTSNGRDTTVTIFNLATLATIGSARVTGPNPDAILYDEASKHLFTFNGRGLNATVLDPATGVVLATIPLPGKPEFAQADGAGLVFVNIESDTGQIVVIDARQMKETSRYWLPGCQEPSGLAYDKRHNRLFSVCGNAVMVVSNPVTGSVVASLPIGPGVDAAAFDPGTSLAFTSNGGDGTMTVVHQEGADTYTVLGNATTQRGSRTMALDPRTHRVYLSAAEFGPAPEPAAPGGRPGRPPMIPGSFSVLVLER